MFAALPLLCLPVLFYNAYVFAFVGPTPDSAQARMDQTLFTVDMASRAPWVVHTSDLLLLASLGILFLELLKSTRSGHVAIINHSLSMVLFITCLIEFLLQKRCATSTFFLIMAMVLLDVLAGFIVSISTARREVDLVR
jgi:hypothetical protein